MEGRGRRRGNPPKNGFGIFNPFYIPAGNGEVYKKTSRFPRGVVVISGKDELH